MKVYLNPWKLYYNFDVVTPNQFYWHNRGTVDDKDKLKKHLEVIINLIFFHLMQTGYSLRLFLF
jgi:hypothetical protein